MSMYVDCSCLLCRACAQYFKSDFENMSDAEKIKQPGVIVGLAILIVPFIVGAIALQVYR